MSSKNKQEPQNPLILRSHRLMEAFAKSDDERDFYIDRLEGFLIYVDLDKSQPELEALKQELSHHEDRYCSIPKLSFYEIKKIMEGFVNEKVYDIDTKEKLLDIIQSKEARENFLEFIYDHHSEQEKWQQFYQERSRIRIIEWLRQNHFHFVFEEDLDLPRLMIEKLKQSLFQSKAGKDVQMARKGLAVKAKTYYSNEALNPRPKRGRPPKQAIKPDVEPQVTLDIYTTVPAAMRPFLFIPEMTPTSTSSLFSSKFDGEENLISPPSSLPEGDAPLSQKLASLRSLSSRWLEEETTPSLSSSNFSEEDEEEDGEDEEKEEEEKKKKFEAPSRPPKPGNKKEENKKEKPQKQAVPSNKSAKIAKKEKKKPAPPSTASSTTRLKKTRPLKKLVPKQRKA